MSGRNVDILGYLHKIDFKRQSLSIKYGSIRFKLRGTPIRYSKLIDHQIFFHRRQLSHYGKRCRPPEKYSSYLLPSLCSLLRLSSNRDLNLDTSLDVDDDLLDDLGRGSQVDEALVDAHLVAIPGLGSLSARLYHKMLVKH